jgi:hypothetical protein
VLKSKRLAKSVFLELLMCFPRDFFHSQNYPGCFIYRIKE